jgi:hypothetical protein
LGQLPARQSPTYQIQAAAVVAKVNAAPKVAVGVGVNILFDRLEKVRLERAAQRSKPCGVQRKNNRSGVLIEQCGGFAISTRNAADGASFAFAASLAPRAIRVPSKPRTAATSRNAA